MKPTPRSTEWAAWTGWAGAEETVPRDILSIARRVKLTLHKMRVEHALGDNTHLSIADLANIHVPRVDWPRPRQVAIYTPEEIRHLIRLDALNARVGGRGEATLPPDQWRRLNNPYWLYGNGYSENGWKHVRSNHPALSEETTHVDSRGWEGAARGWAAGAVLLAVLVLLVRALERFLHRRLFKGRRRSSEEWQTPNVMATSHRFGDDSPPPRLDDSDTFPSDGRESSGNDLPPPYSECANNDENMPLDTNDPNKPLGMEEPPPPYSACYFTNPKDGIPTVHFYNRRNVNSEVGQSSGTNNEPSISNVNENDKISDAGCENANVDNIAQQETNDNNISEVRNGENAPDHVVQILETTSHQGRVVTV